MELPPLIETMSKQQIVDAFVKTNKGEMSREQFNFKFSEALQYIYNCGVEMGMVEALNYVENTADRGRLFSGIDELREQLDEKDKVRERVADEC